MSWTTCGSTAVRATAARQRNGEAGAASGEAHTDHTWLVGLHFRNANPDAAADLVLRLALAVRGMKILVLEVLSGPARTVG